MVLPPQRKTHSDKEYIEQQKARDKKQRRITRTWLRTNSAGAANWPGRLLQQHRERSRGSVASGAIGVSTRAVHFRVFLQRHGAVADRGHHIYTDGRDTLDGTLTL